MERVELSLQKRPEQENTTTHILSSSTFVVWKIKIFSSPTVDKNL